MFLSFLMEVGKQSFSEVIFDLAQRYQIPIKTLEPEQRKELQRELSLKEQLYEILAVATGFYQHALSEAQGEVALTYLTQTRGVDRETIQNFQLGYAPKGWEALYHYLVEVKRYPLELVAEAGLIKKRNSGSGYYDRFRDRLMIPIHDSRGRAIGFGGRALGDEQPKYLNSPDTPLFDKSQTLFALDKAKNSIVKQDRVVIVEGYFDAIALHTAGITNAVASLGTALTKTQLRQILRYTESKNIILNFDADAAGKKATQRAINELETLVYSGQVQLKILHLPNGKDADEFLHSSAEAVKKYCQYLNQAPLWLDWQIQQLLAGKNLKDAIEFQKVAENMVKLLKQIKNSNQRLHYLSHCAELLSQSDGRLISFYTQNLAKQLKKPQVRTGTKQSAKMTTISLTNEKLKRAEELLLLIYLQCPHYRTKIIELLENKDLLFSFPQHRFLWHQIIDAQENHLKKLEDYDNYLLQLIQDYLIEYPQQMQQLSHFFYLNEHSQETISRPELQINSAIASLEIVTYEKYISYCFEQWETLREPELRQYYYRELQNAKRQIHNLNQQRRALSDLEIILKQPEGKG